MAAAETNKIRAVIGLAIIAYKSCEGSRTAVTAPDN
jgi:hypothetical protein